MAEVVDRSRRAEIGSRMSPPSEVRSQKLELEKWKWKMEELKLVDEDRRAMYGIYRKKVVFEWFQAKYTPLARSKNRTISHQIGT